MSEVSHKWNEGDSYEYFMGRWSTLMARKFLKWLNISADKKWLDVGCGTGALSKAIELLANPQKIASIDPSESYIKEAKQRISMNGDFRIGDVGNLPFDNNSFDMVVSGLALNFFPDITNALYEMKRVLKSNGVVAAYVWDYSGRMEFLRYFWDAACQIDPQANMLDEGLRFPICHSDRLFEAFEKAGFIEVVSSAIDIHTVFKDFNDFWNPFLGGQGPAPGFLMSLSDQSQTKLKEKILERISIESNGSIKLLGRALVVKGIKK